VLNFGVIVREKFLSDELVQEKFLFDVFVLPVTKGMPKKRIIKK